MSLRNTITWEVNNTAATRATEKVLIGEDAAVPTPPTVIEETFDVPLETECLPGGRITDVEDQQAKAFMASLADGKKPMEAARTAMTTLPQILTNPAIKEMLALAHLPAKARREIVLSRLTQIALVGTDKDAVAASRALMAGDAEMNLQGGPQVAIQQNFFSEDISNVLANTPTDIPGLED